MNELFEHTLTDMIANFIETAQGGFTQIRYLAKLYAENMSDLANRYLAGVMTLEDFIVDKEMIPVF